MNRYTKLSYGTLNDLPLPELPFEAMGNLLAGYQKQKDFFDIQAESDFSTLNNESDKALGDEVRKYREDISSKLTDIYMKGDTKAYMGALRGGIKNLIDLRAPGGAITALESRVEQVSKVKKELEEQYKDDVDKTNYKYALSQIKVGDVGYDPDARTFNSISKPIYQNFFDIQKRIDEAIKLIDPSESSSIDIKDGYVWKNGSRVYSVREVVDSVMREPEVVEQMRIEAEYAMMNMSDEQKQQYVQFQEQKNQQIQENSVSNISYLNGLLTSENKQEIERGQNILKQFGFYKGDIDGVIGDKTNEAFKQYSEYQEQVVASKTIPANPDNIMQMIVSEKKESYFKYFRNMRPDSETTDVKMMDWKEYLRRSTASMQEMFTKLLNTPPSEIVVIPDAVTSSQVLDNFNQAKDNLQTSTKNVIDYLRNANSTGDGNIFSSDEIQDLSKVAGKVMFIEQNKGKANLEQLYAQQYNLTPSVAAKQIDALEGNHDLVENLQAVAETSSLVSEFEKITAARAKEFAEKTDINEVTSIASQLLQEPFKASRQKGNITDSALKLETLSGITVKYDEGQMKYYTESNGKKNFLNVSKTDVQKLAQAKTKEDFNEILASNSDLSRIYSIAAQSKMDEVIGKEIRNQEMTSYSLASEDLSQDKFYKKYAEAVTDNLFEGLVDPSTNGIAQWKEIGTGKALKTNPGNLKVESFSIGKTYGRPSQNIIAVDPITGKKYEFKATVDPANISSFNNTLNRYLVDNLNEGNTEQASLLFRTAYAEDALSLYTMTNKVPDSNKRMTLQEGERQIAYNYEPIAKKEFKDKNGKVSAYEAVVLVAPSQIDMPQNYRYAVIDKSTGQLYDGKQYKSALDATTQLNQLEFFSNAEFVQDAATAKRQSFTAQEAADINLTFSSGFGQILPAVMSNVQNAPMQFATVND